MGRPKKEVEKVEGEESVDDETVNLPPLPAGVAMVSESVLEKTVETLRAAHLEEKEQLCAKIAELEKELEGSRSFTAKLDADQVKAVEFAIKWLSHLRRQSRGVEFRQEAGQVLTKLSQML